MEPLQASAVDNEDLLLKIKNREDGIQDYLDNLNRSEGKLYITPRGPYSILRDIENDFSMYRKTIIRRFRSKRVGLAEWYVIAGNTPLQPDEDCVHCDLVDDILFENDCWMIKVRHIHDTPLEDDDIIEYLFKGRYFQVTYQALVNGDFPHTAEGRATQSAIAYKSGLTITVAEQVIIPLTVKELDKMANGDDLDDLTFGPL